MMLDFRIGKPATKLPSWYQSVMAYANMPHQIATDSTSPHTRKQLSKKLRFNVLVLSFAANALPPVRSTSLGALEYETVDCLASVLLVGSSDMVDSRASLTRAIRACLRAKCSVRLKNQKPDLLHIGSQAEVFPISQPLTLSLNAHLDSLLTDP